VVIGAGQEGGVFARDVGLVVIAIESPGLKLAAGERPFMHQFVKGMLMMIALFADGVEAGDEFLFGEYMFFLLGHRVNSIMTDRRE
jgi:hypothetical protein